MDYAFHVPINSLSFGQVSIALLRESYKSGHQPNIFLIGQGADLSSQPENKDFNIINSEYLHNIQYYHSRIQML